TRSDRDWSSDVCSSDLAGKGMVRTSGHPRRHHAFAGMCVLSFLTLVFGPSLAFAGPVHSLQEIRDEGVVIQQWDTSCGAAALAKIGRASCREGRLVMRG